MSVIPTYGIGEPGSYTLVTQIDGIRSCYRAVAASAKHDAVLVEVGAYLGRSTAFLATELVNQGQRSHLIVVDTWRGTSGEHEDRDLYPEFVTNLSGLPVEPMQMSRVDAAVTFAYQLVDFLFLDGDHSYEAVRSEIAA